ncbi:MAG: hypothetical protein JSS66_13660 [Armatimonadetes bacterium]|nr:hypothetical protein [Armatimonadota bacterium]
MTRESFLMLGASFLIAVGAKVALMPSSTPTELLFDARVEFQGLPASMTVVGGPQTVQVVASGSKEYLDQLDKNSVFAVVDLSYARAGQYRFPLEIHAPSNRRVTVTPRVPNVRIKVENVSSKEAAVEVEPTGLPPRDLIYDGASVLPERVTIIGAESKLGSVKKVRALLDLAQVRAGGMVKVSVEILDDANRPIPYVRAQPAEVSVSPAVAAAPATKRVIVNPQYVGTPAFGYRVTGIEVRPAQIQVKGESGVMSKTSVVETEPVSLTDALATVSVVRKVRLPAGVRPVGPAEVRVTVKIEPAPGTERPQP